MENGNTSSKGDAHKAELTQRNEDCVAATVHIRCQHLPTLTKRISKFDDIDDTSPDRTSKHVLQPFHHVISISSRLWRFCGRAFFSSELPLRRCCCMINWRGDASHTLGVWISQCSSLASRECRCNVPALQVATDLAVRPLSPMFTRLQVAFTTGKVWKRPLESGTSDHLLSFFSSNEIWIKSNPCSTIE